MPVALFAGSFDPIHLGHISVIEHAAAAFDELVIGVLANPDKPTGLFRREARARLVEEAVAHLGSVRVVAYYGLTVDLATRECATVLVRAAHKDRALERSMAATNERVAGIPTVVVPANPATRSISSSAVRALVAIGQIAPAQDLVPPNVRRALAELSD